MKKCILLFVVAVTVLLGGCSNRGSKVVNSESLRPVLIIDPGHGGADGGAVANDGSIESVINLEVSLKMEALCGLLGYECMMTRDSETLDYPDDAKTIRAKKLADQKNRLQLVNSQPNAVMISIHQNIYSTSSPSGAQALYAPSRGSKELAELIQTNFITHLNKGTQRSAAKISKDIFLINKAECPAVLVECGFMSNPTELAKLKEEVYQKQIALSIISAYIQFISETGNIYG